MNSFKQFSWENIIYKLRLTCLMVSKCRQTANSNKKNRKGISLQPMILNGAMDINGKGFEKDKKNVAMHYKNV